MKIDPTVTWRVVEESWEKETNPLHKQLLGEVCTHMKTKKEEPTQPNLADYT